MREPTESALSSHSGSVAGLWCHGRTFGWALVHNRQIITPAVTGGLIRVSL